MAKLYASVIVGAMTPFPAIRLQFHDQEYGKEPASHIDVTIASGTADELVKLIVLAREAQEDAARAASPPPPKGSNC